MTCWPNSCSQSALPLWSTKPYSWSPKSLMRQDKEMWLSHQVGQGLLRPSLCLDRGNHKVTIFIETLIIRQWGSIIRGYYSKIITHLTQAWQPDASKSNALVPNKKETSKKSENMPTLFIISPKWRNNKSNLNFSKTTLTRWRLKLKIERDWLFIPLRSILRWVPSY